MKKSVLAASICLLTSFVSLTFTACQPKPSSSAQTVASNGDAEPFTVVEETAIETDTTDSATQTSDPDMTSSQTGSLETYVSFLSTLTVHDSTSIPKALTEFTRLSKASKDPLVSDSLFRYFESYFHLVQTSMASTILPVDDITPILDALTEQSTDGSYYQVLDESSFSEDAEIQMSALLRNNGYAAYFSEAGYYLSEDPYFLLTNCSSTLSPALQEYLTLRSNYLKSGAVIDDAGLRMSWDELSDRIVAWESYASKYPDTPEAVDAMSEAEYYFDIYLTCRFLDNTPMFRNDILTDDVKASYERFLTTYPTSSFYTIISEYYDLLKQNHFKLTTEAVNYLAKNNLDISIPTYSDEPYVISSNCFYPIQPSDIQTISIVMTKGDFYEQTDAGPNSGWIYEGYFVLQGRDANDNLVSTLDLNESFDGEPMVFNSIFDLAFEDYNQDGFLDFSIGQWGSSNGNLYKLFTINADSKIIPLPTEDNLSIFASRFDYSAAFEKDENSVFLVPFYDNTVGKNQIAYYRWDGNQYLVSKTEFAE